VLPAAVAHHLKVPFICCIEEAHADGAAITVTLRTGGRRRRLAITLPAVITVSGFALASPVPDGQHASVEVMGLADLAIDRATITHREGLTGALEKSRLRVTSVKSADELLRRWLP
jgi:electron transfer flavoprotein alpha/beta subunit